MMLVRPRFVSLDTSLLGALAEDFYARNSAKRQLAREFLDELSRRNWIILACWHHFEELVKHASETVASTRVDFLRSMHNVGWVGTRCPPYDLGSIVDIFLCEVTAVMSQPSWTPAQVRDHTRAELLRFGTGIDAFGASGDEWRDFRPILRKRESRQREIASISQAVTVDKSSEPLRNMLEGKVRAATDASAHLGKLGEALKAEIIRRGDRRLSDVDKTVREFLRETVQSAGPLYDGKPNAVRRYIEDLGIEVSELDPNGTMNHFLELAHFRQLLKLASRGLCVSWDQVRNKVDPEQIPSFIVQRGVRRHRALASKAEGGDLTDSYLLCLALFADLTIVDKRTKENHRRMVAKDLVCARLLGPVERVPRYTDVLKYAT